METRGPLITAVGGTEGEPASKRRWSLPRVVAAGMVVVVVVVAR